MDKKKVKELIEDTLLMVDTIEGFDDGDTEQLLNVRRKLNGALDELSKSDWVSVEDGLPEPREQVWVRNKISSDDIYVTCRYKGCEGSCGFDRYGFLIQYSVTHWKPIEKLEE